ncbi:FCD domain-containing protein [Desulfovibrio aminophilus]|uniref:GntR family transcriptional regulator n=1 Tax=Desulfovibrio aminophilus TaxID=81425 RepID=UPI003390B7C9
MSRPAPESVTAPMPLPFGEVRGTEKGRVYACLRDWILFSELAPGLRLNERELAERFGISRTPLREVLQLLSYQGLVVIRPRHGIIVAPVDEGIIRRTFEVRLPLEREVARLAALRATPDDAARLEDLARLWAEAYASGDVEAVIRADDRFHNALAELAGNPVLLRARESLHNICLRYWFLIRHEYVLEPSSAEAHVRLAEAVTRGDAELAAALQEEHVRGFARLLERE